MDMLTVGDIAQELEIDRDAVSYAIRKTKIQPIGRAGIVRLFPLNSLVIVRDFIDSKRKVKKCAV